MLVALIVLAAAGLGVWSTMEAGKYRSLAWVLLGFFAFRVVVGRMRQQQQERREAAGSRRADDGQAGLVER